MLSDRFTDISTVIDSVESKEQVLLQHIRTSGLKTSREASLVEEVIELRRLRRIAVSELQSQIKGNMQELQSFKDESAHQIQLEVQRKDDELNKIIQSKDRQLQEMHMSLESAARERELQVSGIHEAARALQKRYEGKIAALEARFDELRAAKQQALEEMSARDVVARKKELDSLQGTFDQKMNRYKEALKAVSEREGKLGAQLEALRTENSALAKRVAERDRQLEAAEKKANQHMQVSRELTARLEREMRQWDHQRGEWERQCQEWETRGRQLEVEAQSREDAHKEALRVIDEKVRRTLVHKDRQLDSLRVQLQEAAEKEAQLGTMLGQLQGELGLL